MATLFPLNSSYNSHSLKNQQEFINQNIFLNISSLWTIDDLFDIRVDSHFARVFIRRLVGSYGEYLIRANGMLQVFGDLHKLFRKIAVSRSHGQRELERKLSLRIEVGIQIEVLVDADR